MSGNLPTPAAKQEAIDRAEAEGFTVVRSDARTLLLDLDTHAALEQFYRVLPVVEEHYTIMDETRWRSKSGNTHVKLTLAAPLPIMERYALQAALGSDGVKEVLSILGLKFGCIEPALLFQPTDASKALAAARDDLLL